MNHTYQPSGKISPLFWLTAPVMFVIMAAVVLLCVFGIQVSHATLLDVMIYFATTKCIAKFGAFLCVKGGRVRNPAFAKAAGIVLALGYWMFLIVFYTMVQAVLTAEKSIWVWEWDGAWKEALAQFAWDFSGSEGTEGGVGIESVFRMDFTAGRSWVRMLWEPVFTLQESGAVITGKSGNALFIMPGVVCDVVFGVMFLAAIWQFGFVFRKQGRAPFCEASGKWAKKTVLNLQCRTEETLLSRLLLGDTAVLAELEPLGSEDADCYFKIAVYAADENDPIYVSVSKMTKVKKHGQKKPVYEEEQVAEYLVTDRGTGFSLLLRSRMETAK